VRSNVIIVENFYRDPMAIRDYALRERYYHPYQANAAIAAGHVRSKWQSSYFREAADCPFKSSQALRDKLAALTGEAIDLEHWNRSFPTDLEGKARAGCEDVVRSCLWNCSFHFKPEAHQPVGEGVHNHVTDIWNGVGPDGWACLIYLSPDAPLAGGLKLWRNHDAARDFDWMTPSHNWELVDDIGNVFNRLILVRGNLPHSGAAGWADQIEHGRLFQTFFFRSAATRALAGLEIRL
jgi:hypothetical protein